MAIWEDDRVPEMDGGRLPNNVNGNATELCT